MPTWVKVLTVLVTLPAWLAVVIAELVHGEIPSPALMAIPAGVVLTTSGIDVIHAVGRALQNVDFDESSEETRK